MEASCLMERMRFRNCHFQSFQSTPEIPFPETPPVSLPNVIAGHLVYGSPHPKSRILPTFFPSSGGAGKSENSESGNGLIRRAASITTSAPCKGNRTDLPGGQILT